MLTLLLIVCLRIILSPSVQLFSVNHCYLSVISRQCGMNREMRDSKQSSGAGCFVALF